MSRTQPDVAASLLIHEIRMARAFLGVQTMEAGDKQLKHETVSQLIQESQILAAAIQLRQQREVAENVRAAIAFDNVRRSPKNGPLMS